MMRVILSIALLFAAISTTAQIGDDDDTISFSSGEATIRVISDNNNQSGFSVTFNGTEIPTLEPYHPVYLEVKGEKVTGKYSSCKIVQDKLIGEALIRTERGSEFAVHDTYISKGNGVFELQRSLEVVTAISGDSYFNSLFGFRTDENCTDLTKNEYFVPGVWYKANFTTNGNIPTSIPQVNDTYFYYREDRITLPLVMFRDPASKNTVSIIHKDSDPQTVIADAKGTNTDENYQYGALGIKRENDIVYTTFIFPGSEASRKAGKGSRYHPLKKGLKQQYNLEFSFSKSSDYASALRDTWNRAFQLYDPKIYEVNLSSVYNGLIETLLKYYVPSTELGGIRDAAGFPFEVGLDNFQPRGIDYQMGFVGMQVATAYYLFREGVENRNNDTQKKGESALNFWANNCLSYLGLPRTWYDPGLNGNKGSWRSGSDSGGNNIRVSTGGMEALIAAWCFAKRNHIERPQWINACVKFGDWLVNNQNTDGSFYFSYNPGSIQSGKHPVNHYNKFLTICAVRYLVELHIATNKPAYKTAALKAGEYCYQWIHENYCYVAGVVDNPQTIDSESGQMALNGFLSLYDLTKESKWLQAAEQAATYTESWVYSFEIPVEKDRTGTTNFPKNRSIVGQHLIAIGHSAADLGFAWSSFVFYRLYLETGNEHYLQVARVSAHNTKQSMNWDDSLFPGEAKGLQMEAFQVTIPRRMNGIMTALNWNYAAHLDPMFRFKDAFGTPDLEEVEKMSMEERLSLNAIYSQMQSANYGQEISSIFQEKKQDTFRIYPNPVKKNEELYIEFSEIQTNDVIVEIFDITGKMVYTQKITTPLLKQKVNVSKIHTGQYTLRIREADFSFSKKIIIQ